jgi:hypothetical protein
MRLDRIIYPIRIRSLFALRAKEHKIVYTHEVVITSYNLVFTYHIIKSFKNSESPLSFVLIRIVRIGCLKSV